MDAIKNFNTILNNFKLNAQCVNYHRNDNYFHYDLQLNSNIRIKDIQKISDEIALALKAPCKPSFKILHQEGIVRLEFAKNSDSSLNLISMLENSPLIKGELPCLLGRQSDGQNMWMDLSNNPHMIISGTTGSGKSTLLHNIIGNLLRIKNIDISLIDPKRIEFAAYNKFNNITVNYSYNSALATIESTLELMEFRYELLNINDDGSNLTPLVLIIDEFSDLILQDENSKFYNALCKLAQKCRAAKIYLILSTQRPTANIINGNIKANFPARIACKVSSHVDSKVILDAVGAENLIGKGDALVRDNSRYLDRFQVAYASAAENIKHYLK